MSSWPRVGVVGGSLGGLTAALARWEPGQLALGRSLLERAREMGDRSPLHHTWIPGDPSLRLSLYGPGR